MYIYIYVQLIQQKFQMKMMKFHPIIFEISYLIRKVNEN